MRRALLVAVLALGLPGTADAAGWAQAAADLSQAAYVPGEVIVKFRAGVTAAARTDALRDRGARLVRSPVAGAAVARVPQDAVGGVIDAFERDPRVSWAEPNVWREAASVPDDPLFGELWGLHNSGQAVAGVTGVPDADIDAPEAWERTTGSSAVRVAVVDTGVTFTHPDLAPNLATNPGETGGGREGNGRDDDANGYVDDWRGWDFVQPDNDPSDNYGHGTHVAGTLAARGNNALGVTGVAWRTGVVPVRVLDNFSRGTCAELAAGLAYAVRLGVRVVNLSVGGALPCRLEREVIESAPETLFVVAAMNDGADVESEPVYPCSFPSQNIVCVAASDASDRLAGFSNYGADGVDLAAPGAGVLSTYMRWGPKEVPLSDGFETPLAGRWITGGNPDAWERTIVYTRSGYYALSDSPFGLFANDTDNFARLAEGLDLTGRRDCALSVWVRSALGPFDPSLALETQNHLTAETARDGLQWRNRADAVVGTVPEFTHWLIDLSPLEGAVGGLRFRLRTNGAGSYEGVALDDLEVICVPPLSDYTGAREDFDFDSGTSMAAPQVSGTAALLLSLAPQLSAGDLKRLLMDSVDPQPTLQGTTVSGGRLNAARALALSPRVAAGDSGGSTGPSDPGALAPSPRPTASLTADLRALVHALSRSRIRSLLRRGGFRAGGLYADAPGHFTVKLTGRAGGTLAVGARSVARPGRWPVTVRLTRRGRRLLARARRPRVELRLTFAPRSGPRAVRRAALTLRR